MQTIHYINMIYKRPISIETPKSLLGNTQKTEKAVPILMKHEFLK